MADAHAACIPLNTDDPTARVWTKRRPRPSEPHRKPGLMNRRPRVGARQSHGHEARQCGRELRTRTMFIKGLTEPDYLAPKSLDHGQD